MIINLDLNYRLKKSENTLKQFIEPHEAEELNARIRDAQVLYPHPDQARDMLIRVAEIKSSYYDEIEHSLNTRVSAGMLRTAVELRYRIAGPQGFRVEVPRKGPEKTKPGVWWGELLVQLEEYPKTLEVSPIVAQWLVATWQDEKVQNALPAEAQSWANVFDTEIERVAESLGSSKSGE
jgi:hypothetical protein